MVIASGVFGRLLVGYQQAARLGNWSVSRISEDGEHKVFQIHAGVVLRHAFWSQQRPLDIELVLGERRWVWRDVSVTPDGEDAVTITVHTAPDVGPVSGGVTPL